MRTSCLGTTHMNLQAYASKWGVLAAVRRDLHSQRVPPPEGLAGRVIILCIPIPTRPTPSALSPELRENMFPCMLSAVINRTERV